MPVVTENQDGTVTVVLKDPAVLKDVDVTDNLATRLSPEVLAQIGKDVVEDYKVDLATMSPWMARRANFLKLFSLNRDEKTFPWENCSNVGMPTISIAAIQFQARAFEAITGEKDLVKAKVTDEASKDAGLRVAKHMNHQLGVEMEDWEEDMDTMLLQLPLNGSTFKKTYWNHVEKRVESLFLGPDSIIINYNARRIEKADRITHILEDTVREIKQLGAEKFYVNTEGIKEPSAETAVAEIKSSELPQQRDATNDRTAPSTSEDKVAPRLTLEQHRYYDLDNDGIAEAYICTVDSETSKVYRIQKNEVDVNGKMQVLSFFTHYVFIPNPDGLYGYGFGHFLEGINEAINALTNQIIDSGTLANVGSTSGFFAEKSGIKKGTLKFAMGQFQGIKTSSDDIRKSLYQFEFNPPSVVLFNALNLLQEYANNVSTVSDAMLGKLPPSDTTATTMLAVLEQGLKVFSTIQRRIHRSLRKELKKIYILNSIYSEEIEESYRKSQDSLSEEYKTLVTAKADYDLEFDIIPTADPNMVSQAERFIKARQAWEFALQNPLINKNENALWELSKEYLLSLGFSNVDSILPAPTAEEPQDLPALQENAGFIEELPATVLPEQDHAAHLADHQTFAESDFGSENLTPQGKNLLDGHIRETLAALYLSQQEGQIGSDIAGGNQGVAGGEGDASIPESPEASSPLTAVGNVQTGVFGGVDESQG